MKKKQYLHTNFVKFLVEKYNKKVQDEETDLPQEELTSEEEETEDDEPIEDLIAEYEDLYKNLRVRSMVQFLK